MVQRWAVVALLMAEKRFKRVKGYREIPKLVAALEQNNLDRVTKIRYYLARGLRRY